MIKNNFKALLFILSIFFCSCNEKTNMVEKVKGDFIPYTKIETYKFPMTPNELKKTETIYIDEERGITYDIDNNRVFCYCKLDFKNVNRVYGMKYYEESLMKENIEEFEFLGDASTKELYDNYFLEIKKLYGTPKSILVYPAQKDKDSSNVDHSYYYWILPLGNILAITQYRKYSTTMENYFLLRYSTEKVENVLEFLKDL